MMHINMDLFQWFRNFLINKHTVQALYLQNKFTVKNENISNKESAEELHKPLLENSRKEKFTQLLYRTLETQT